MSTKKKILIAEDEVPMAHALELELNGSGYKAKAVYNGEEVLAEMKKENYDLLLLDIMMPKMDGLGVLEALKKIGNKMPIIVSTNLIQENEETRVKKLGAVDYFVKSDTPITEVVERVKKIIGK